MIRHGTYIGPLPGLHGETALIQRAGFGVVKVQFDNLALPSLAYGWHEFPQAHWTMNPVTVWEKQEPKRWTLGTYPGSGEPMHKHFLRGYNANS